MEGEQMREIKWLIQLAGATLVVLALIDQGRRNGWI